MKINFLLWLKKVVIGVLELSFCHYSAASVLFGVDICLKSDCHTISLEDNFNEDTNSQNC